MAFTADVDFTIDDIETWLIDAGHVGDLDVGTMERIVDAVYAHASRHYDLDDVGDETDDERDQALIMQCAHLYMRKHSSNGYVGVDELAPVRVLAFDHDVQRLLAGRLTTAGLFGPSSNTAT